MFIIAFTCTRHLSLSSARLIQSIPSITLLEDMSYYYTPIYGYIFQVVSFLHVSHHMSCIHICSTHSCYKLRPSHFSRFDHPNNFRCLSSSLDRFMYSPVMFTLLGTNFPLSIQLSKPYSIVSSFKISDQISHQYQTTGNIYLCISKYSKLEGK
jgi:hypothetical protein